MKRGVLTIFVVLLAACAQTAEQRAAIEQNDSDAQNAARVHTELAAAWYARKSLDIALEEANKAVQSSRSYAPAHNMRGLIYMELGEDAAATQAFERALAVKPGDAETSNNYGWFLCSRGKAAASIPHFMTALADPLYQSPEKPLVNAGICTRKAGDDKKAEAYFRRALLVRQDQPQANYHLADMAYKRGDFRTARAHAEQISLAGNPPVEALWLKVRMARKFNDRKSEADAGLQLRRRFPQARETLLMLRGVYE